MVSAIFTELSSIVSAFTTLLISLFGSVVSIFYTSTGENQGLTIVGVLTLVGMGVGLVMWGFNYIKRLIRVKAK